MMNMKKLSSTVLLGAAFAIPATAHELTVSLGLLSAGLDSNFQQYTSASTGEERYSANNTELGGEAAFGYVWTINSGFDMAFELFYDFTSNTAEQTTTTNGNVSNTVSDTYGIRVLPGFYVTSNTKIFLDIGWANMNQDLDISKVITRTGFSEDKKSESSSAYRYGAGVQTMIYDNFSLRASYVVTDGASKVSLTSDDGLYSYSATPTIQTFAVDLSYHFHI